MKKKRYCKKKSLVNQKILTTSPNQAANCILSAKRSIKLAKARGMNTDLSLSFFYFPKRSQGDSYAIFFLYNLCNVLLFHLSARLQCIDLHFPLFSRSPLTFHLALTKRSPCTHLLFSVHLSFSQMKSYYG